MTWEDITFGIFSQISEYTLFDSESICFRFFLDFTRISSVYLVFWESARDWSHMLSYEIHPLHSIEVICIGFLCKCSIPIREIISLSFPLTNPFQKSISLTHDSIVLSSDFSKLPESPFDTTIDHISPHTRGKIEEIHIEWRYEDCPIRELLYIFHSGEEGSLDLVDIFFFTSDSDKWSYPDIIEKWELKLRGLMSRRLDILEWSPTREMDCFEDMCLSRTIPTDDTGMIAKWQRRIDISPKTMNVKRSDHGEDYIDIFREGKMREMKKIEEIVNSMESWAVRFRILTLLPGDGELFLLRFPVLL